MPDTLMSASSSESPLSSGPDKLTPATDPGVGAGALLPDAMPESPAISAEPPIALPRSSVMPPASAVAGGRRSRPEISAPPAIAEPAAIESSTRSSSNAALAAGFGPAPTSDAKDSPEGSAAAAASAWPARTIVCEPACTSEAANTQSPSSNEPPTARSSALSAAAGAGAAGASRSSDRASESEPPSARSPATRSISSALNLSVLPSRIGNSFFRSTRRCTSSTLTLSCRAASSIDRNFPAILRVLLSVGNVGAVPDNSSFVAPTPPFYRGPSTWAQPAPPLRTRREPPQEEASGSVQARGAFGPSLRGPCDETCAARSPGVCRWASHRAWSRSFLRAAGLGSCTLNSSSCRSEEMSRAVLSVRLPDCGSTW